MADRIAVFPESAQHTQTITWGDRQVRLRLTYRQRLASWYMDVYELPGDAVRGLSGEVGDPIVTGRRVSVRWPALLGLAPEGLPRTREVLFLVVGPIRGEPYVRAELGAGIQLYLFGEDEIPAQSAGPASSLTVVLA